MGTALTFGSLFAGAGGFDLGMEAAGLRCCWQVEWDKACQNVLRHHWPDVPKWGDISTVNGAELAPVDVIIFGSPCQDLSVAGKRAGMDGDRSNLFFEATRIIKEMRNATESRFPRYAVWENVPGALTSNNGHDFAAVIDSLAEAGALVCEWAVLDAQWFGVPQRRRRIFVVAVFDPRVAVSCPDPLLPVGEGVRGDFATKRSKREGTTASLTRSFGAGGPDLAHAEAGWLVTDNTAGTLTPGDHGGGSTAKTHTPDSSSSTTTWWDGSNTAACLDVSMLEKQQMMPEKQRFPAVIEHVFVKAKRAQSAEDFKSWVESEVSPTANAFDVGDSRTTVAIVESNVAYGFNWANGGGYGNANPGLGITEEGTGPLSTSQVPAVAIVAPTLTASNNPSRSPQSSEITQQVAAIYDATSAVRRLTPLECERLQGWPDNHTRYGVTELGVTVTQADTPRYRQIGNGVASPVATWIAQQILKADQQ